MLIRQDVRIESHQMKPHWFLFINHALNEFVYFVTIWRFEFYSNGITLWEIFNHESD